MSTIEPRWKSTLSPHLPAMSYKEQLQHAEWNRKRCEIWQRDKFQCVRCQSKTKLRVHHKEYKSGVFAWEYPSEQLESLCDECHTKEHGPKRQAQGVSIEDGVSASALAKAFKAWPEGAEKYFQDARQYQQFTMLRTLGEFMEKRYFQAKNLIESGKI